MLLRSTELKHMITMCRMSSGKQTTSPTFSKRLRGGYNGEPSLFDKVSPDDLIFAFFPCTRFEARVPLLFRGQATQQKGWDNIQKLDYSIGLHRELHEFYVKLSQLCVVAYRKGLKMIIENPYTQPHYLTTYWCIKPSLIDKDRTQNGDYYKKPTQYWFINFKPKNNLVFEPLEEVQIRTIARVKSTDKTSRKTERSLMHNELIFFDTGIYLEEKRFSGFTVPIEKLVR